jgi:hypothetical protein
MPFSYRVLLVSLLLVVCFGRQLVAQPERLALAKAIASELQTRGVRLERPHVVVYVEAGLIPEADHGRWAGVMSDGVGNIESFLKASFGSTKLIPGVIRDQNCPGDEALVGRLAVQGAVRPMVVVVVLPLPQLELNGWISSLMSFVSSNW